MGQLKLVFLASLMLLPLYSCQSSPQETLSVAVGTDIESSERLQESYTKKGNDTTTSSPFQKSNFTVFGEWEVVRYVGGAFAEIDEQEAEQFVGKKIELLADTASLFQDRCISPTYRTRLADSEEHFYYNFRTYPKTLGIESKEVKVVEIYCSLDEKSSAEDAYPEFSLEVFNEQTLVYFTQGYFFYLNRTGK